jgi:hypothetical protein
MTGKLPYTVLLTLFIIILIAHAVNAVHIAVSLPNCARTYVEGMHSFTLQFHLPLGKDYGYPPLYEIGSRAIYAVFGQNYSINYLLNNTFYFAMLLLFSYLFGKAAYDKETGIILAILVSIYPVTSAAFNGYSIDFPLMGLVMVTLYAVYRSDSFLDARWSILVCLGCIAGLFMKQPFAVFVMGPLLYSFCVACRDAFRGAYKRLAHWNAVLCVVLAAIYAVYGKGTLILYWGNIVLLPSKDYSLDLLKLGSLWIALWKDLLSVPFFIAFILSSYAFLKYSTARLKTIVFLWIVIPTVFVVCMPHMKSERMLLPLLPALALITAVGLRKLIDKRFGLALVLLVMLAGIGETYYYSYQREEPAKLKNEWLPMCEEMSLKYKLASTSLSMRVSTLLLNDMNRQAGHAVRKNYNILCFPEDWTNEQYFIKSFFLFNSQKHLMIEHQGVLVSEIAENNRLPVNDVDYLVQLVPAGHKRENIYRECSFLRDCYVQRALEACVVPRYDTQKERIENWWYAFAGDFEDCGLLCADGRYTVYLYRNKRMAS